MRKLTAGIFSVLLGLVSVGGANAAVVSTEYLSEVLQTELADMQTKMTATGPVKIENNVVSVETGAVSEQGTNLVTAAGIYAAVNAAVADLKVDEVSAGDGKYFGAYKQVDGKISMSEKSFDDMIDDKVDSKNAPTVDAVKDYVGVVFGAVGDKVDAQLSETIQKASDADELSRMNKQSIDAINSPDTGILKTAQTYADNIVSGLADGVVATNTANIATLNGDATTAGSVAKAVADAKSELQGNINLKADKTALDATDAKVAANETAIADEKSAREAADAQLQTNINLKANIADVYSRSEAEAMFEAQAAATAKLQEAKDYTDTQLKTLTEDMWGGGEGSEDQGLQGTVATQALKISALEDKVGDKSVVARIAELDSADTAVDKEFVTAVSETDGVITVSRRALAAADIPVIAVSQVDGLQDALDAKQVSLTGQDGVIVIADGVVSIASQGIGTDQLKDGSVTADKMAKDSVTSNAIAAGAVTAGKIATDAVIKGTIADGAVEAGNLAENAVQKGNIAAGAVDTNSIADNAVGAAQLASDVNSLLAGAIQAPSETNADGTFVLTAKKITVDGKVTYSYAWEDIAGRDE